MSLQYILDNKGKKTGVFIPIEEWERLKKTFKDLEKEKVKSPTKSDILNGLKEALEEVKLHQEGKIKLKSARELLDEI